MSISLTRLRDGSALMRLAAVSIVALGVAACGDEANSQTAKSADAVVVAQADTSEGAAAVEAPEPQGEVDMEAVLEEGPLPEMVLGEADAPVTIVEYMSLTCPHCAAFHTGTFEQLKEKYIDTGDVRFIVRDFPFDPRAAAGAMLARCAPEGQYFPMVDMLFEQQQSWAAAENAQAALLQISRMAGFTQESFEACLTNQELLDDVNAVRQKGAEEFQVQSTPTFLINGERYAGNMSIEQMSAIIDGKL
ncbi:DsbA family protein [Pararhizobium haloflavum]|uniref:DsbA family protein n=1 Tax=Pararhizobium haloflavum TaxID=2037914 RepID=UPI000C179E98|nr:DsbA family protein [Pararhizobium haloflavum]